MKFFSEIEDVSPMTLAIERRAAARHDPPNAWTDIQIKDWAGHAVMRSRLVNISATGALVVGEEQPELYRPLWIRVVRAPEHGWIAGETVRFEDCGGVGIRFYRRCPQEFLMAATSRQPFLVVATDGAEVMAGKEG